MEERWSAGVGGGEGEEEIRKVRWGQSWLIMRIPLGV